ncbi:MAG: GNAT family N-acetyltransferase [Baekduia sp.]
MAWFSDPAPLAPGHATKDFDCGVESLNLWLKKHAIQARAIGSARTFVVSDTRQQRVVGYYALTAASITHEEATARTAKGMPRHPIPAALLARLAIDKSVQGHGVGAWLLLDAMLRTMAAAESVGIRVLLVHAIDDAARGFYEHHGFEASPTDRRNLQMLMKEIRAAARAADA